MSYVSGNMIQCKATHIGVSFKSGEENLNVVSSYKYLGLIFTEHFDYQITAKMVAQSAS